MALIKPAMVAVIPIESPTHGIYIYPAELYKKPTRSPKKQAAKPKIGPMIIPVNADATIVKENCVSANLNSNIFAITTKAVIMAIYAILWLRFFFAKVLENKISFQFVFFCIIKTSRKRSASFPSFPHKKHFNAYMVGVFTADAL